MMNLSVAAIAAGLVNHVLFLMLSFSDRMTDGLPEILRIGGLFDDSEDKTVEGAFQYAIFRVNQDKTLLPKTKIVYDIQHLPAHNSFVAAKKVCNQASLGVAAIFGPKSGSLASYINSMCNTLEIPHVEARLEPRSDRDRQLFSINVYPQATQLSRAYLDLLKHFNWNRFCVIYGDHSDLLLMQSIIRAPLNSDVEIIVRQATRSTMRETLKEINKRDISKILVHLTTDDTYFLLKAALQVGMIDEKHHYIVTNLDFETIDLEDFRHNHANITGFRLIDRGDAKVQDVLQQMQLYQSHAESKHKILNSTDKLLIKVEAALVYDAVYLLAHALEQVYLLAHTQIEQGYTKLRLVNLSCDGEQAWAFGSSLYSYINLVEMEGLTGFHSFDCGKRQHLHIDILQLLPSGLEKVGWWSSKDNNLNFTRFFDQSQRGVSFGNTTLRVTSIIEAPYVMKKKSDHGLAGNDQFEGFCVDLLKEIAEIVGFRYTFGLVEDGKYGSNEKDGWTGMVRELMDKKAELAAASLTISYLREQVIDFTKPFMNLGISILFKRPRRESPGLFSFLNPLAIEIWVYVIAAYLLVSLMMYVLARFSPYEWYNPHPCNPDNNVLENIFTLSNAFWFAVGTLMQQGSDINPRAVSTRIVGGMWWFFTLIIISSYTANLAAFLTVERMVSPIESAEDLAKQNKIAYGTIFGGSTMTFFRESKLPTYQRMWSFMDQHQPSVFVQNSEEGIARTLKGDYAFLMESTMIDYNMQRNCELMQVGGLLDSKGYGIGTQIGSPYRDPISMAILKLQESGRIQVLYNKWWKNTGICVSDDKKKESKASSLGVANVGGIFVVLFVGLALAIVVAILEFVWNSRKHATLNRITKQHSVWSEMMEELRFAIRCYGSTKKPRLKRRCSQCTMHHDFQCAATAGPTPPAAVIDSSPNGVLHPPRQIRPIQSPNFVLSRDNEMHYRYHDVTDRYNDVLVDKNHVIGDKEANNTDGSNVRNDGRYNSKLTYYPQK